jgi:hypothetical protein
MIEINVFDIKFISWVGNFEKNEKKIILKGNSRENRLSPQRDERIDFLCFFSGNAKYNEF